MSHLNYFKPYLSKDSTHEDQLTRAFLVLLRYSNSTLFLFYDLAYQQSKETALRQNQNHDFPSLSKLNLRDIIIETQVSEISENVGQYILSVLLTDSKMVEDTKIKKSNRGFRYDGLITISDDVTLIIENKPNVKNVWKEQLNPNLSKLSKEVKLLEVPAVIEWKSIISRLNDLVLLQNINGVEKLLIEDFLEFVNENFSFLNPFDKLALCKNNLYLLNKRLETILQNLVTDEKYLGYQIKWKSYFIKTGLDEIQMIIFKVIPNSDESDFSIRVSFYFGDTMNQSKSFYKRNIPFSKFDAMVKKGWGFITDFHISAINTHLVWFPTTPSRYEKYYNYWINHQEEIKQYSKEDYLKYNHKIIELAIIDDLQEDNELYSKLINTKRTTVNVCPAVCLSFDVESKTAIGLDGVGKFENHLKRIISEGLLVIGEKAKTVK